MRVARGADRLVSSWSCGRSIRHLAPVGCAVSFFFFQAEDGIRDVAVTGVQTCALPIWIELRFGFRDRPWAHPLAGAVMDPGIVCVGPDAPDIGGIDEMGAVRALDRKRSEERRVGEEGRSRWSPDH